MDILTRYRETLINRMDELLGGPPSPVLDMCRYHLGLAEVGKGEGHKVGKMVRPALCLAFFEALAGGFSWQACVPAALAVELVHRSSLIFDDIQDDGPLRNHRPTVWTVWGVDQALNAGLALSSYARLALEGLAHPLGHETTHRILERTVIELCRGQYMDIAFQQEMPTLAEYLEMVRLKTGALMGTACELGALVAGRTEEKRIASRLFGEKMGVAFQLQDDCLDIWGKPEDLGKTSSDLQEHKRSLPVVLAMEEYPNLVPRLLADPESETELLEVLGKIAERAGQLVRSTLQDAMASLDDLEMDPTWAETFKELGNFMATRVS